MRFSFQILQRKKGIFLGLPAWDLSLIHLVLNFSTREFLSIIPNSCLALLQATQSSTPSHSISSFSCSHWSSPSPSMAVFCGGRHSG